MTYSPQLKLYYGKFDSIINDNNRLVPAPQISIKQELLYANDTVVGYNYLVSLQGYATSVDLTQNRIETGIEFCLESLKKIKSILNMNGGILLAVDSENNPVIKATGGVLRSFTYDESDNKWVNYIPYSVEMEFNEIEFGSCDTSAINISCENIPDGIRETPDLIDMKKYRIKSFNDSWSFTLDDNIYNGYNVFRNDHFNISYQVSAEGKHYFKDDKVLPSWEQAKNFCQYKVYSQVKRLISGLLSREDDGCSPSVSLEDLHQTAANYSGIFGNESFDLHYTIYNETITCETSESDGSFNATYNAILKRKTSSSILGASPEGDSPDSLYHPDCLHTFNVSRNIEDDGRFKNITISIDGNIQGLIEGGLIINPNVLEFPENGALVISKNETTTKYSNALGGFNKVGSKIGLNNTFLSLLEINNGSLGVSGECINPSGAPPVANHSVAHNYHEGSITYKTDYTTERACNQQTSYRNISVSIEDSTPIIAEFVVPGRSAGPIIQKIGPSTPMKITINIDGADKTRCCASTDISDLMSDICSNTFDLPSGISPAESVQNKKLVQDQFTSNPIDGSYSISRVYTCCGAST